MLILQKNQKMRKFVVAIDSMKGCLSSEEASSAFAAGIRGADPEAEVLVVPVADGGEGTAMVLADSAGLKESVVSRVTGPMGNDVDARWWYDGITSTAFIDMAQSSGLTLVAVGKRNPLLTTGYGLGQLICKALDRCASTIVVGLGGSATVDGGVGACQALGIRFLDSSGTALPAFACGRQLSDIAEIDISGLDVRLKSTRLLLVSDVTNPFTGHKGAARVFGPQKGASDADVAVLDAGLEKLRSLVIRSLGVDLNEVPGSGAAGGCCGSLMALAGGIICDGASFVLNSMKFESLIKGSTAVVTGEGASDEQTLMGKLPYGILRVAKAAGLPVALVAGVIRDSGRLKEAGFSPIVDINDPENIDKSSTAGMWAMNPVVAKSRLIAAGAGFASFAKNH